MGNNLVLRDTPRYECLIEMGKLFPDMDPSSCLVFLNLIKTTDDVWRIIHKHLGNHGISQGRFLVLMLLIEKTDVDYPCPKTPAEIAGMANVSRATVTGLLDNLEKDGFVSREPDSSDRRVTTIRLTEEGHAFMGKILPPHFRILGHLMQPLDGEERDALVAILNKISAHIENTQEDIKSI
ncbi:MAG: MarR family transcriptional regulator [Verrucomicrobiota bacterium]